MKVTISPRLGRQLSAMLQVRKDQDPEVMTLLNQLDRGRKRDQNLDLDELEAVLEVTSNADLDFPRTEGNQWPTGRVELVRTAREKLMAMKKKILDGAGAVDG